MTRTFRADRIEFDSAKKITETDTEIIVPTIFTRESILPFEDGRGYRSAEQLQKYGWTLEGAWLVAYDHIPTVFPTDPDQVRGRAKNVKFSSKINGLVGDSCFLKSLCDQPFQETVRKGNLKDVSVGYFSEDVMTPGKFGDEPYDFAQTKFFFGHLATGVVEGRCPSPYCGMSVDSLFAKPHGDPEVTEKYVRIRVRDPNLFVDGSFRTIVLSAKEGIHAIIGKLKSDPKGATVVQNYMFEVAKEWTMENAQAWVKEHKDAQIDEGGQPKTDKERFMAHFGIDEKAFRKLYDLLGDELFKLLPERGEKVKDSAAQEMSEKELRAKIEDLSKRRQALVEKLYPRPPEVPEEEAQKLRLDLTLLDVEVNALTHVLAEKIAGVEPSGESDVREPGKPKTDALDPAAVLERSRKLLS